MTRTSGSSTRARSLCRVHWRLGQALLPEHFERQELAFQRELALRFAQLSPPAHGVAQIDWDEDALAGGIIRLTRLVAILPRGHLVDLPGNARSAPLDLSAAGAQTVRLHAHLLAEPSHETADERARDLDAVELVVQRVELSCAPAHPGAIDSLKLAELAQAPDGTWTLRPDHVPPLLTLAAWPSFFERVVTRLRKLLARWEDILLGDLGTHALSVAKGLRAHECLRRSRLFGWFVTQIDPAAPARAGGASHPDSVLAAHPFEIFRRLVELYLDVHAYASPPADDPPLAAAVYDHRDIAGCFERLLAELESRTRLPHGHAPYAPFVRNGRVMTCALPPLAERLKLYWLVRRSDGVARTDLRSIKLAAASRLEAIHRHALRGIAVRPLASAPFRHDFDPSVELYEIATQGDEWRFALRESRLAYVAEGAAAACETHLFWRDA